MSKRMLGNGMLLMAAMIWGAAFVAQSVGMEYVGPFTFQASRSFLGGFILIPLILLRDHRGNERKPVTKADKKFFLLSGFGCGILLFVSCSLQQIGLLYTTAGKSGFITSLYIILVPLAGLFIGKKVRPCVWISVALAIVGMYLLCGSGGMSFGLGEWLTLGCSAAFTCHILLIDHVSPKVDPVRLSSMQFLVCGVISAVVMFLTETPNMSDILRCWMPIAYSGILSYGVAYTFQIIGQSYTNPTVASLLMSLESVFAMLFGWLLLHEALTVPELCGCALVFSGVILAQMPEKKLETI